jgi:GPH family glycoside/pentoside/hexuronide:cation symporter
VTPLKKWQEPIYALGSLGPTILSNVVLSWILFYYRPSEAEVEDTGALLLISALAASAVWIAGRLIDAICDIPIASWTDNMRSRWGRRRPMMALGLIPMAIAFILIWYPPVRGEHWANALWMAFFSSAFFFFYTFIIVPYLALLSEMVEDEAGRLRIASWQAVFYAVGMASAMVAGPKLIAELGYQTTAWLLVAPGVLCFLGPILVVRERPSDGTAPEHPAAEPVPLWSSIVATLTDRTFAIYMLSMGTFWFGMQLFLTSQPYYVTAVMDQDKGQLWKLNAAAFGLIPLALPLLNLISRRKGTKWAYRLALLAFGVIMLLYPLTWARLNLPLPPLVLGMALNGLVSYSAATFMTIPSAFPAEIAHQDTLRTGKHRAGMYFAVQGVINQTIAAVAGALIVQLTDIFGSSVEEPYGVVILTPIAGVLCFASWALFAPYPLGKPRLRESEAAD